MRSLYKTQKQKKSRLKNKKNPDSKTKKIQTQKQKKSRLKNKKNRAKK